MTLAEPAFLLFALMACLLYRLAGHAGAWRLLVLVSLSLFFYSTWNPWYCLPIVVTALLDYNTARLLHRAGSARVRKWLLAGDITLNLSILVFFKYFNFLLENGAQLAAALGRSFPSVPFRVAFVVGISFYTFQSMSYVIDVYRGDQQPANRFLEYLAFVSFFPTLLAGPITRARVLLPRLQRGPEPLSDEQGGQALFLIALGFFKKLVIADYLSINLVDRAFELPRMHSSAEILVAIYAFAVQIYCDFSGYSDIAIGVAHLLGFRLPDNFNSPYRAEGPADFWRRWHISFSTWLRDYIFFALPASRRSAWRPYWNTVVTFALGGLWHGASWTFLIWGLLHGLGLSANRAVEALSRGRGRQRPRSVVARIAGVILTFHFVCITWVFFRCDTLQGAFDVFAGLARGTWGMINIPWPVPVLIGLGLFSQWLPENWFGRLQARFVILPSPVQCALLAGTAVLVGWTSRTAISQFIYFRF